MPKSKPDATHKNLTKQDVVGYLRSMFLSAAANMIDASSVQEIKWHARRYEETKKQIIKIEKSS